MQETRIGHGLLVVAAMTLLPTGGHGRRRQRARGQGERADRPLVQTLKLDVIDQARSMGVLVLNVCGSGESLLDPDIREVVVHARA
jgi:hypothetical protein